MFADEDEDEEEDSDEEEEKDFSFKNSEEFVLPLHDYDHLVTEVVVREPSRNPSPSPMRTTRAQREGSQTPSVADSSRASSPDEDDSKYCDFYFCYLSKAMLTVASNVVHQIRSDN